MQVMASIPSQMAPTLRDSCMTTVFTAGVRCHTQMVTGEQASLLFLAAAQVQVCITLRPCTEQSYIQLDVFGRNFADNCHCRYEGQWRCGVRSGHGECSYSNGNHYKVSAAHFQLVWCKDSHNAVLLVRKIAALHVLLCPMCKCSTELRISCKAYATKFECHGPW